MSEARQTRRVGGGGARRLGASPRSAAYRPPTIARQTRCRADAFVVNNTVPPTSSCLCDSVLKTAAPSTAVPRPNQAGGLLASRVGGACLAGYLCFPQSTPLLSLEYPVAFPEVPLCFPQFYPLLSPLGTHWPKGGAADGKQKGGGRGVSATPAPLGAVCLRYGLGFHKDSLAAAPADCRVRPFAHVGFEGDRQCRACGNFLQCNGELEPDAA